VTPVTDGHSSFHKSKKGVDFMRYIISGKNIDITSGLRDAVESKIGKLERYFSPDTEVQVTMSVEKGRQKIEVTIPVKGNIIRAEQDSNDMYVSIDLVEEIIERQIKKYRTKLIDKKQNTPSFSEAFLQEEADQEETIHIEKTKRFAMKPMDPEEACIQMELLGHNFFMFLNAETDEVNVVYKRKANSYGLIEPEF
jgi:putative sigma-54 modulation protein